MSKIGDVAPAMCNGAAPQQLLAKQETTETCPSTDFVRKTRDSHVNSTYTDGDYSVLDSTDDLQLNPAFSQSWPHGSAQDSKLKSRLNSNFDDDLNQHGELPLNGTFTIEPDMDGSDRFVVEASSSETAKTDTSKYVSGTEIPMATAMGGSVAASGIPSGQAKGSLLSKPKTISNKLKGVPVGSSERKQQQRSFGYVSKQGQSTGSASTDRSISSMKTSQSTRLVGTGQTPSTEATVTGTKTQPTSRLPALGIKKINRSYPQLHSFGKNAGAR